MLESFIEMMKSIDGSNKQAERNSVYQLEDSVCYLCGGEVESDEGQYGCENCQRKTYDRKQ